MKNLFSLICGFRIPDSGFWFLVSGSDSRFRFLIPDSGFQFPAFRVAPILRSKARWHEHAERNTRYFFNLEKRNHSRKTVTKLKIGNNKYVNDQFAILEGEKRFYKSQSIDNDTFLTSPFFKTQNITPLTQEEMESCEGLLSEDECLNAIKEFKNNKSPRTDGFTSEFYKFFWPELK